MGANNILLNGPVGIRKEVVPEKPYAAFAYNKYTGEPKMFTSREERNKAFLSGDWVDTPAKCEKNKPKPVEEPIKQCPFWDGEKCTKVEEKPEEEPNPEDLDIAKGIMWDENHFEKPVLKTPYISQMNAPELIRVGKKHGFDWESETPTKRHMIKALQAKNIVKDEEQDGNGTDTNI